jgi:hypothetical protein
MVGGDGSTNSQLIVVQQAQQAYRYFVTAPLDSRLEVKTIVTIES